MGDLIGYWSHRLFHGNPVPSGLVAQLVYPLRRAPARPVAA